MVINTVIKKPNKRGRPKNMQPIIDQGTPELQARRQKFMHALMSKIDASTYNDDANVAIFDGCYLHQLFYRNLLTENQFETALCVRKIYSLCTRSQGIKNRLLSSFKIEKINTGSITDIFEDKKIESQWKEIQSLINKCIISLYDRQLFLKIVLNDYLRTQTYDVLCVNDRFLGVLQDSLEQLASLV